MSLRASNAYLQALSEKGLVHKSKRASYMLAVPLSLHLKAGHVSRWGAPGYGLKREGKVASGVLAPSPVARRVRIGGPSVATLKLAG